mmetsp:Transcript_19279/g.63691  ORF Transcript_19279/g.63691 Transcript_19279/m.63691 type:complete len:265 (-) Transcript_19279:97-891(-)
MRLACSTRPAPKAPASATTCSLGRWRCSRWASPSARGCASSRAGAAATRRNSGTTTTGTTSSSRLVSRGRPRLRPQPRSLPPSCWPRSCSLWGSTSSAESSSPRAAARALLGCCGCGMRCSKVRSSTGLDARCPHFSLPAAPFSPPCCCCCCCESLLHFPSSPSALRPASSGLSPSAHSSTPRTRRWSTTPTSQPSLSASPPPPGLPAASSPSASSVRSCSSRRAALAGTPSPSLSPALCPSAITNPSQRGPSCWWHCSQPQRV